MSKPCSGTSRFDAARREEAFNPVCARPVVFGFAEECQEYRRPGPDDVESGVGASARRDSKGPASRIEANTGGATMLATLREAMRNSRRLAPARAAAIEAAKRSPLPAAGSAGSFPAKGCLPPASGFTASSGKGLFRWVRENRNPGDLVRPASHGTFALAGLAAQFILDKTAFNREPRARPWLPPRGTAPTRIGRVRSSAFRDRPSRGGVGDGGKIAFLLQNEACVARETP